MQHNREARWLWIALTATGLLGCGGGGVVAVVPAGQAEVPQLQGLSLPEAVAAIENQGLVVGTVRVREAVIRDPAVAVIEQTPTAATPVLPGSAIDLLVSFPEDPGLFLLPDLDASPEESAASATSYYKAIDPDDAKTTLTRWLAENGFGTNLEREDVVETSAAYANDTDLGFGRYMRMRRDGVRYAFVVENYDGLDDAIDRRRPLNTVAMEFAPGPAVNGADQSVYYTKFYAFDANGDRTLDVDLDGRGEKFLPEVCLACHGGKTVPPVVGVYPKHGEVGAPFIPFDLSSLRYSTREGYAREDQEGRFHALNEGVRNTFARTFTYTAPISGGTTARRIPDPDPSGPDPGGLEVNIPVAGLGPVNYLDVTFDGLALDHDDLTQLVITLTSPAGMTIDLMRRPDATSLLYERATVWSGPPLRPGGDLGGIDLDSKGNVVIAEFFEARDVAVGNDDTIYVLWTGGVIGKLVDLNGDGQLDPTAGEQTVFDTGGLATSAIAWDKTGNRLLATSDAGIIEVDTDLGSVNLVTPNFGSATFMDLVVDGDGVIWFLEDFLGDTYIWSFADPALSDPALSDPILIAGVTGTDSRLSIDATGVIWITDSDGLLRYADGAVERTDVDGSFGGPATTADGRLFLLEVLDHMGQPTWRVREFDLYPGDFRDLVLEDDAVKNVETLAIKDAPFKRSRRPDDDLATFQGESPNGVWVLRIVDEVAGFGGSLRNVSLHFGQSPRAPQRPHVVELIEGWYGGSNLPRQTFMDDFLPVGWSPPAAPADARDLYFGVVARSCRLCHAQLARFDFSNYEAFNDRRALVKKLVYEDGTMPLARRTFQKFWLGSFPPNRLGSLDRSLIYDMSSGDALPGTDQSVHLADFLAGHFASGTEALGPGIPVARAGAGMLVNEAGTTVILDGTRSAFDDQERTWSQIAGPPVELAESADGKKVSFFVASVPDFGSPVVLKFKLAVTRGIYISEGVIGVKLEGPAPVPLHFTVETIVGQTTVPPVYANFLPAVHGCIGCHDGNASAPDWSTPKKAFDYLLANDLIDLGNPDNSKILNYPLAGTAHTGGNAWGALTDTHRVLMKQWIVGGALP